MRQKNKLDRITLIELEILKFISLIGMLESYNLGKLESFIFYIIELIVVIILKEYIKYK